MEELVAPTHKPRGKVLHRRTYPRQKLCGLSDHGQDKKRESLDRKVGRTLVSLDKTQDSCAPRLMRPTVGFSRKQYAGRIHPAVDCDCRAIDRKVGPRTLVSVPPKGKNRKPVLRTIRN